MPERALAVVIALCLSAPGCGSVLAWADGGPVDLRPGDPRPDLVFAGARTDLDLLVGGPSLLHLVGFLDLPFSLVFDAVALPVTIPSSLLSRRDLRELSAEQLDALARDHEDDPDVQRAVREERRRRGS